MAKTDVVVIGGGPAGYVAARRLGQLGVETILVEKEHLGGTCLNLGCIPTKTLYAATLPLGKTELYRRMGLDFSVRVDLPRLRAFLSQVVENLRSGVARLLAASKVEILRGEGRVLKPGEVEVISDSKTERIEAKAIVLAMGSAPVELSFLPFDGERVWSSDHALALPQIPERMAVVGGGVVGLELATVFRRLGAKITVVEMMDGLLPGLGLSRRGEAFLRQSLERQGIEIRLKTRAAGLTKGGLLVDGEKREEIEAEVILVAVGRRPLSQGLADLGLKLEKGFVVTDESFRAGPGIYAIGDLRGGALLAHKASHEGLLLAETLAAELRGETPATEKPKAIPWTVFTDPPVA
ncbi:MAG: FAD-dependent oxidoreductase, partial [Methanomassiliicoccales archaeon]|nr:FAD-dependent oxidoreductase [Methanomassiliicoccales archaeon]